MSLAIGAGFLIAYYLLTIEIALATHARRHVPDLVLEVRPDGAAHPARGRHAAAAALAVEHDRRPSRAAVRHRQRRSARARMLVTFIDLGDRQHPEALRARADPRSGGSEASARSDSRCSAVQRRADAASDSNDSRSLCGSMFAPDRITATLRPRAAAGLRGTPATAVAAAPSAIIRSSATSSRSRRRPASATVTMPATWRRTRSKVMVSGSRLPTRPSASDGNTWIGTSVRPRAPE